MAETETIDTAKRFEYQWNKYDRMLPHYEEQFLSWIDPLTQEDFKGRDICDAGCGMGRHAYFALKFGAKSVVAVDNAPKTVASARRTLQGFPNATVEETDIYDIPYENHFDLCYCIGVIHHLVDPKKALDRLVRALKPGGKLLVWLYSYEGNEAYVRLFQIFHPLLKGIPPKMIHVLAYLFSVPLYMVLKMIPFKSGYFHHIKGYPFRYIHLTVYDQLLPAISRYYKRNEVEALFQSCGLSDYRITHYKGYSWKVIGNK